MDKKAAFMHLEMKKVSSASWHTLWEGSPYTMPGAPSSTGIGTPTSEWSYSSNILAGSRRTFTTDIPDTVSKARFRLTYTTVDSGQGKTGTIFYDRQNEDIDLDSSDNAILQFGNYTIGGYEISGAIKIGSRHQLIATGKRVTATASGQDYASGATITLTQQYNPTIQITKVEAYY